jgi:endonuclease/exonuclease/phosphatase family metal-dependent hydrolase
MPVCKHFQSAECQNCQAEISKAGRTYQVFVTHLGNGGPIIQLENILSRVQDLDNVIVMGDVKFRPPTEQYALITQTLADSWLLKWPDGKETLGIVPERRIDHIFVSPSLTILEAEYAVSPVSDHSYTYIVIEP